MKCIIMNFIFESFMTDSNNKFIVDCNIFSRKEEFNKLYCIY